MKKNVFLRTLSLVFLFFCVKTFAQTNFFVPTTGAWNTNSNWSLGTVPGISNDVVIAAGKTVTGLSTGIGQCRNLTVMVD